MNPPYNIQHDDNNFHWNNDLETLFQQIKISITKDFTLTLPNSNHPFFITVESCLIRIGCVLFQMTDKGKLDIVSYASRLFTTNV